jgi:hypothetical protein
MDNVRIQTGATERVEAIMLDGSLAPLTGLLDALLSVRRVSDGYWLYFSDDTFKASGWTTRQQVMSELDSTNDPGVYGHDLDTSAITNMAADDTLELRADCASAVNTPQTGEIKVGQFVDNLDAAVSSRAAAGEYDTEMARLDVDVSSRAAAGEYDTEMARLDVDVSSRAPAGEYDTDMAHLDVDVSSRASAADVATLTGDISFIKDIEGGRWHLTGGQMIFYKNDNTTEVARFDITNDINGNPIERTRV